MLVNFWGLRCGACIAEIPHLNAIHEEFSGKGLVTLGVNVDGADPELLRELLAERPVKPAFTVVCDPEFAIAEAFGLKGAPLTVLIDREGIIRYRHENFSPGDEVELRAKVRDALPSGDAGK